ncbi:hypothetical protein BDU57DRAFT_570017 [Ampelomyces quisqualis]|uniref:Uncharacterized protein n=1 Tax=Ampelomyces quisqualis TaxID=50730 RepID=A0A6A5QVS0_AMPQU|nr:hypothetical protein BDU57DRAFT_570017 [Ampelomyces quisqualis]
MCRTLLNHLKPIQRAPSPETSDGDTSDSTDATISISASKPPSDYEPDAFSARKGNPTPPFDYFLSPKSSPVDNLIHKYEATSSEKTAFTIRETRLRFARGTPDHGGDHCTALDRRTVLDIYAQALGQLSSAPEKHIQIAAECTRKVRVVLSLITADPDDIVFLTAGQLLSPLEPQYANPRIERGDDQYGYRAQWRLHAWRREGWPGKYPGKAIEREMKTKGEGLVGKGKVSDAALKQKFLTRNGMWEDGDRFLESMDRNPTHEKGKEVAGEGSRTGKGRTRFSGPYNPRNADEAGDLKDAEDSGLEDTDDDWS